MSHARGGIFAAVALGASVDGVAVQVDGVGLEGEVGRSIVGPHLLEAFIGDKDDVGRAVAVEVGDLGIRRIRHHVRRRPRRRLQD